ncbi:class I SAM-dependent methyltransferase [Streptomyces odonnellii]|uniref:class I SAM-dependent methyltransferase n=1 Tax=Streptomyces odonnellii TaxID=1417980 RepID=UPI00062618C7|nr:class I SAM-dependent methyltransferase [Streptomyces odonnellii]
MTQEPPAVPVTGGKVDGSEEAARPFDALGLTYEETYAHLPEQLAAIDWLLAELPEGAKVLDIGSGTGRPTAERISAAGHHVSGYDVSQTMVDLARAQVPAARFELSDVRALPDTPGAWDAITAFFSLHQMPRADLDVTFGRIANWLAPGGLFVLAAVPLDVDDAPYDWMGQTIRATSYPAEVYPERLRGAGLEIVHNQLSVFHPDFPGMGAEEHQFLYARRPRVPEGP